MFRNSLLTFVISIGMVLSAQLAAFGQYAPTSGKVVLQKADGTREPVAGALVEVYRTDVKGGSPPSKTNKKGEFSFAGLMLGGEYTFAVSAPNAAPALFPVKPGQENVLIVMSPGDGSKYTEADVRKNNAKSATNGTESPAALTEEQLKAKAEYEAKVAKNEKILKTNEVVALSLKQGNEAFGAKNYDLAVSKYDEGIAADPDFVGSAPVLNSNRATALSARATDYYNQSAKVADATEKVARMEKVKKDYTDAAQGYMRSFELLKTVPAPDVMDKAVYDSVKLGALRGAKDTFEKAVRTKQVTPGIIDAAKVLIPEYLSIETDAAKKHEASIALADLYRVSGDSENAVAAYSKILETSPDDVDALSGAGFSLVNVGYLNNDKAKLQEGANLLQKFASLAPDTNKYKADAVALIETLKAEQNVTPVKLPTGRKKN